MAILFSSVSYRLLFLSPLPIIALYSKGGEINVERKNHRSRRRSRWFDEYDQNRGTRHCRGFNIVGTCETFPFRLCSGGINAALDTKEGDSTDEHFYDTIYGGDFFGQSDARERA